ncbi:hypothetical protein R1flu_022441 [Riccia fluitans]|uniref:Uncharacterized protein n=1 Tax=Riccia fluitans TaxID=41844 RepID=A0ABD1XP69_9MARC
MEEVRRKFGLGRRDPRANGAERKGTRLRARYGSSIGLTTLASPRGSISFSAPESRDSATRCTSGYRIAKSPQHPEAPLASLIYHRFRADPPVVDRRPALFFLSHVGASPSEL